MFTLPPVSKFSVVQIFPVYFQYFSIAGLVMCSCGVDGSDTTQFAKTRASRNTNTKPNKMAG